MRLLWALVSAAIPNSMAPPAELHHFAATTILLCKDYCKSLSTDAHWDFESAPSGAMTLRCRCNFHNVGVFPVKRRR